VHAERNTRLLLARRWPPSVFLVLASTEHQAPLLTFQIIIAAMSLFGNLKKEGNERGWKWKYEKRDIWIALINLAEINVTSSSLRKPRWNAAFIDVSSSLPLDSSDYLIIVLCIAILVRSSPSYIAPDFLLFVAPLLFSFRNRHDPPRAVGWRDGDLPGHSSANPIGDQIEIRILYCLEYESRNDVEYARNSDAENMRQYFFITYMYDMLTFLRVLHIRHVIA